VTKEELELELLELNKKLNIAKQELKRYAESDKNWEPTLIEICGEKGELEHFADKCLKEIGVND
jgi:hypothetical protein